MLSVYGKFTLPKKDITITAKEEKDKVAVTIEDQGIGIPEDDLSLIFKEFYRVESESHRQEKGTGLGLSLVRNIIRAHKGQVWAESSPGQGSKFIFTLPKK